LRILPGLGHCPHDEAPELVNAILLEWILLDRTALAPQRT
jgi:pimeloyl-ACP methyl ester carboxylesterase